MSNQTNLLAMKETDLKKTVQADENVSEHGSQIEKQEKVKKKKSWLELLLPRQITVFWNVDFKKLWPYLSTSRLTVEELFLKLDSIKSWLKIDHVTT